MKNSVSKVHFAIYILLTVVFLSCSNQPVDNKTVNVGIIDNYYAIIITDYEGNRMMLKTDSTMIPAYEKENLIIEGDTSKMILQTIKCLIETTENYRSISTVLREL